MSKTAIKKKSIRKLDEIDRQLEVLLHLCSSLDATHLHAKPNNQWSPAQIIQHLYLAENGTLGYMEKKSQRPVAKTGLGSAIRSMLLTRALRNKKKKYRAPGVIGSPDDRPDFAAVAQSYRQVRADMRRFITDMNDDLADKAIFKHPVIGPINLTQTLSFLQEHMARHADQVKERMT